jgi:hypothetical protein
MLQLFCTAVNKYKLLCSYNVDNLALLYQMDKIIGTSSGKLLTHVDDENRGIMLEVRSSMLKQYLSKLNVEAALSPCTCYPLSHFMFVSDI